MSKLLDAMVHGPLVKQHDDWYQAKPVTYPSLWLRITDAWLVLIGRAVAVHYKEDEK